MKRVLVFVGVMAFLLGVGVIAQGPATNALNLKVKTDANNYLISTGFAYTAPDGPATSLANIKLKTDANGYLITTTSSSATTNKFYGADGTNLLPTFTFSAESSSGWYRAGAGDVRLSILGTDRISVTAGNAVFGGNVSVGSGGSLGAASNFFLTGVASGQFKMQNDATTFGVTVNVSALPTVSACGAGSPAVAAGSTAMSGSVTIGTTAVATCTITFNGTAFPSAPHCSGVVETATAANTRTMGYSASGTVLTIVPSVAWADSSVVNWNCFSSR